MMTNFASEVKLSELEEIKALFELISDNFSDIKEPLASRIKEWVDAENKSWVSWSDLRCKGLVFDNGNSSNYTTVVIDGEESQTMVRYNKILRKVVIHNDGCLDMINAKSFSIKNNKSDNFLVEW